VRARFLAFVIPPSPRRPYKPDAAHAERRAQESLNPVYTKRREALKKIDKFWPVALTRHSLVAFSAQHDADRLALSYLEDVWVVRDKLEPKVFTIEFVRAFPSLPSRRQRADARAQTFKENPFFSDRVLKKEYRFVPPNVTEQPDADGITQSMLDFSWERDVVPQATKIAWKDEAKSLTKLYPLVVDEEDPEDASDPGSFFNFFETDKDYNDVRCLCSCSCLGSR
jgi:template-activating factor I